METLRRIVSGFVLAVMVFVAIGLAVWGSDRLTQATQGVGIICLAVFVAVLARLAQAADHHAELRRILEREPKP